MKKKLALLLVMTFVLTALVGCGGGTSSTEEEATNNEGAKTVGVFFYQFNDTYLSMVRNELDALDAQDADIEFISFDAADDQGKQNDQLDAQIEKVDVFLINLKDTGAAEAIIGKLKDTGKPIVFFNREPDDINAYKSYDKAKFVGTKIEEAGILQGELVAEYWEAHPEADRNGNGKLDYVLLHGGLDNGEAIARSEYSVKTLKDKGIEVNEIAMQIAEWKTDKAKDAMDAWMSKNEADIDIVLANNDGMAIGALNSLKSLGFNTPGDDGNFDTKKYIAVFGVDATDEAKAAIGEGTMSGTVMQDSVAMAKSLYEIGKNAAEGKDFLEGTAYQYDESGFAVRIPYAKYEVQ